MEDRMKPLERKAKTEALLAKRGIPYFQGLPCIESEEETELRTPKEVGMRICCLFCVIGTAYNWTDTSYKNYLKKHDLWNYLTPSEMLFLSNRTIDQRSAIKFTWRSEALFLLLWTVSLIETLPLPTHQTDNERIISLFPSFEKSPWPFIYGIRLRSKSEILDVSDLLYRLHWAVTQAQLDGQRPPAGLNPEVIYEWHHAINWVTRYENLDWDAVRTDT